MKSEIANKILSETETGYDLISQKFSQTRKHFWRELEFIRDYTHEKDNVLDFGCGNGRLLELLDKQKIDYYGVDVSEKLVEIAEERYGSENKHFSKINPSQTSLAFDDRFFNSIYSVAVFHHFPSRQYRQEVAGELFNKTKNGGHIIITVWNLWQKRYFKNIWQNWLAKIKGESMLDWNDCQISFTDNQCRKIERFHHAFTERELKKLFAGAGFKIEKCEVVDGRNIVLIGKKE
jgi:ubiquinone/menaquinone biosynthesis C-methylase UbiE